MDDTTQGGLLAAALFALAIAAAWIDHRRHPKHWCRTCKGTGRLNSWWSKRWKDCKRCDGGVRNNAK